MQEHVLGLVREALKLADAKPSDISCIAYTKARQLLYAACIACYTEAAQYNEDAYVLSAGPWYGWAFVIMCCCGTHAVSHVESAHCWRESLCGAH